jgi:hypothetical protein
MRSTSIVGAVRCIFDAEVVKNTDTWSIDSKHRRAIGDSWKTEAFPILSPDVWSPG